MANEARPDISPASSDGRNPTAAASLDAEIAHGIKRLAAQALTVLSRGCDPALWREVEVSR